MNFRLGAFSLHSRRLWHFGLSWPSQTEELEGKLKLRTAKTKWSSGVHAVSSTTAAVITISNGCVERGTQQQHPSSSHVMFDKIRGGGIQNTLISALQRLIPIFFSGQSREELIERPRWRAKSDHYLCSDAIRCLDGMKSMVWWRVGSVQSPRKINVFWRNSQVWSR